MKLSRNLQTKENGHIHIYSLRIEVYVPECLQSVQESLEPEQRVLDSNGRALRETVQVLQPLDAFLQRHVFPPQLEDQLLRPLPRFPLLQQALQQRVERIPTNI